VSDIVPHANIRRPSDVGSRVSFAISQDDAWFDSVSVLDSDEDEDFISLPEENVPSTPSAGGATGNNIPNGQVVQFESSSCFVDGKGKYEEYHETYLKIDGSKAEKFVSKGMYKDPSGLSVLTGNNKKKLMDHASF
jgi:hypothetical protein